MVRLDPSESVASLSEIPGIVRSFFDVEYEVSWHGTILHLLYPLLNTDLANQDRADFDSIIRLIVRMEDILIRQGVLSADFIFMICRPKSIARAIAG